MLNKTLVVAAVTCVISLGSGTLYAADVLQVQNRDKDRTTDTLNEQTQAKDQERLLQQEQEVVYGSQLMSNQERNAYRSIMRSMKTQEERNAFRLAHHKQMQERARAQGVTLPDVPPATGAGMRQGGAGQGGKGQGGYGR